MKAMMLFPAAAARVLIVRWSASVTLRCLCLASMSVNLVKPLCPRMGFLSFFSSPPFSRFPAAFILLVFGADGHNFRSFLTYP